ncbi:hypothetical protein DSC47_11135 [Elizabethkingia miricola]|uniref:phosphoribosyltransferase-like protein n=1 Tax=Elizabethkingia bruuniana TaxID=1756149 RepID=UPI000999D783|nr:hypothetical protein [Elizabethkingia bruuniana]OPC55096.1 hypothetical protein BAY07_19710 [Elizabethkingia bruuniana]OPC62485.1 hypothetical protein BAY13_06600 [Elizabethkingia bruuniana]RBI91827.1 hypothetical protein DSC47_11135 [Elizabethkingia miricola]
MSDEILLKAKETISFDDFQRIMELLKKYKWLFKNSEGLYNLWAICNNDGQKKLIEHLLKNFTYTTSQELEDAGKQIVDIIVNKWEWRPENTFIVAKCDDRKPDGSQLFLQSIKNKFPYNWNSSNFFNNLLEAAHNINNDSNIILIDDFIGTGDTIKSKYKYFSKKLRDRGITNYCIKIISFAAMDFSRAKLNSLNDNIEYYSFLWLKKGIRELILDVKEQKKAIAEMKNIESNLAESFKHLKLVRHSLGYKESEALFNLESFNIPNNVFPIFWWPNLKEKKYHQTMFRRL